MENTKRQKICKNLKNFLDKITLFSYNHCFCFVSAGLAQLVEHLPCKQRVGSSSLLTSSIVFNQCLTRDIWCWVSYSSGQRGQTVNLLAFAFRGSNPRLTTIAGVAQLARASAFQAEGRGFEPRFPLHLRIWRINWELFFSCSLSLNSVVFWCLNLWFFWALVWLRGRALPW